MELKARKKLRIKDTYLASYNAFMAVGWAWLATWVLLRCLLNGPQHGYDAATTTRLCSALQWTSILETVHAALGLVHSGVSVNLLQWCGRAHALFLVVRPEPSLHTTGWATLMLIAWGLGEACRYPKYVPCYSGCSGLVCDRCRCLRQGHIGLLFLAHHLDWGTFSIATSSRYDLQLFGISQS